MTPVPAVRGRSTRSATGGCEGGEATRGRALGFAQPLLEPWTAPLAYLQDWTLRVDPGTPLRVLFCGAPHLGLGGRTGGILQEMHLRREALLGLGHHVDFLRLEEDPERGRYDVAHVFMANAATEALTRRLALRMPVVVSPIIDRSESDWLLRSKAWVGALPGVVTHVGACRTICAAAHGVCARSRDEQRRVRWGLGVAVRTDVVLCPTSSTDADGSEEPIAGLEGRSFSFFVGDMSNPRKNVVRLIQAAKALDHTLVLAGRLGTGVVADRVRRLAETSGNVVPLGLISEDQKRWAMRTARVFVLPSTVEGIGLAAIEAAQLGTTVVTTGRGGARDYLGPFAYYVNPRSIESIRGAMARAWTGPLDARPHLRERLDPTRCGKALVACYRRAQETFDRAVMMGGQWADQECGPS